MHQKSRCQTYGILAEALDWPGWGMQAALGPVDGHYGALNSGE